MRHLAAFNKSFSRARENSVQDRYEEGKKRSKSEGARGARGIAEDQFAGHPNRLCNLRNRALLWLFCFSFPL